MPMYTGGILKSGMLEIGIALTLHDRFTTGMDQASKEMKKLYRDAQNGVMANLNAATSIADMGSNLFDGMINSISGAAQEASGFMDTMVSIEAITEATAQQMDTLSKTARRVGFSSIFSIPEIGSGMKYLAMAGATADEINSMIEASANVAGATGLALGGKGGAADVITNVMRTFVEEGYSAVQVGDIMTKAALRSNMSMADMAASIRYASADVTNLGYNLEEASAMIGTLGNMGIQGSMAGTALANMMRYLSKSISDPAYKGGKALASLGISPEELVTANGQLRDIDVILTKIKSATAGLTDVERLNILTSIFGVRGNRAATALMRDLDGYRKLLNETVASSGYAGQIMEKRMESLYGHIERFREGITNLKTTYTQTIEPIIKPMIKIATNWLQGLATVMESKVFGPTIGFFTVAVPLAGRFITTLVKWRAVYLLLARTDTMVTLKNIWTVLTGGWSAANAQATGYLGTLQAIKAAHMGMAAGSVATSMVRGGISYQVLPTKNGKGRHIFRDETGRILRHDDPRVTNKYGDVLRRMGKNAGSVAMGATMLGKAGRAIGGLGRGLFTMMGGWPGLILTGVMTLGPLLVQNIAARREANRLNAEQKQAMQGLSQSVDSNTAAVGTLAAKYDTASAAEAAGKTLDIKGEMKALTSAIIQWRDLINSGAFYRRQEVVIRGADGTPIGTVVWDDYDQDNLDLGTK